MFFDYSKVEKIIGYTFKDKDLLKSAFIHSSFANENRKVKSNERLEFLGDSVLQLIVTEYAYAHYKNGEGDLSKIRASLVSEKSLSFIFNNLGLDKFIFVGAGLKNTKPTQAMNADAFEALVASVYLDGGMNKATSFVLGVLDSALLNIKNSGVPDSYKSKLQELDKSNRISYDTKSSGEGQEKSYLSKVYVNSVMCGVGLAQKKRDAEELAAKEALGKLKKA